MTDENTKFYVIDASFLLAFLLPDERDDQVSQVFEKYSLQKISFIVPVILPFEVINGLKSAFTSQRIDQTTLVNLTNDFEALMITLEKIDLFDTLAISLDKKLSVYDASYVSLAKRRKLDLLTLDTQLKKLS